MLEDNHGATDSKKEQLIFARQFPLSLSTYAAKLHRSSQFLSTSGFFMSISLGIFPYSLLFLVTL